MLLLGVSQRLLDASLHGFPDFLGIMFSPSADAHVKNQVWASSTFTVVRHGSSGAASPCVRCVLLELHLVAGNNLSLLVEYTASSALCPLINGSDALHVQLDK